MQEFMVFAHTEDDHLERMSPEAQQSHVQAIGAYLQNLMQEGKLKGAQPLQNTGARIVGTGGTIKDAPFIESKELIVGYFHIEAKDMDEAIAIAKQNPILTETECYLTVRPIKSMEGLQ